MVNKRGRKKKWQRGGNDVIIKYDKTTENINDSEEIVLDDQSYKKESINFGNMNVTVHTSTTKDAECDEPLFNITEDYKKKKIYHNNPSIKKQTVFTSSTGNNILCYNCCHNFINSPFFFPVRYDNKYKRYKVFGNFCSLNCTKRYGLDNNWLFDKIYMIRHLYIDQCKGKYINPAPPKIFLKCFGGQLTINEYRESSRKMEVFVSVDPRGKLLDYEGQ